MFCALRKFCIFIRASHHLQKDASSFPVIGFAVVGGVCTVSMNDSLVTFIFSHKMVFIQPIKCRRYRHIETNQLICCVNQLPDFCMRATPAFNGLSAFTRTAVIEKSFLCSLQWRFYIGSERTVYI